MERDTLYWIWLSLRLGVKNRHTSSLIGRFGSPFEIYRADEEQLTGFDIDGNDRFCSLADKDLRQAKAIYDVCEKKNISVIGFGNNDYPTRLRSLTDAPTVLYCLGKLPDFDRRLCIGVVGTRKMTEYGCRMAYGISYGLASAKAIVVSGLALGVDSVSACAALEAEAETVAVLGCGVDVVYPKSNTELYREIIRKGAVISEYCPGTHPDRTTFPTRNRIISGLSQGSLIVEADYSSGAMITAKDAMTQGRRIFAIPGNVGAPNSNGPNSLIRSGATPVGGAFDIINEFLPLYSSAVDLNNMKRKSVFSAYSPSVTAKHGVYVSFQNDTSGSPLMTCQTPPDIPAEPEQLTITVPDNDAKRDTAGLSSAENAVYNELKKYGKPQSADRLNTGDALSFGEVLAALTMLEVRGLIESLPGGMFTVK